MSVYTRQMPGVRGVGVLRSASSILAIGSAGSSNSRRVTIVALVAIDVKPGGEEGIGGVVRWWTGHWAVSTGV